MNHFLYRPQRGSLVDAMKEMKLFVSRQDLYDFLRADLALVYPITGIKDSDIECKKYTFDDRIGWDTYIITVKGSACGFTNANIYNYPPLDSSPKKYYIDNMIDIGTKVSYIRQLPDYSVQTGTGILKGIGLDLDGFKITLIKPEEGDAFNTPLACVNSSPDFQQDFKDLCLKIKSLSDEGNDLQEKIVKEYNDKLLTEKKAIFGEPVEI